VNLLGPIAAAWHTLRLHPPTASPALRLSQIGLAALDVARQEIGHGEVGRNNAGPDLDRYRAGGPGGPWCAAFVSHCLEQGARQIGATLPLRRSHGARTLFARCVAAGERVEDPRPGDVVLWSRGAANSWTGHVGIVSRVENRGFWSVEGNRGAFPSRVREYGHECGEANLIGFARLP
jgi:hypothetical protein